MAQDTGEDKQSAGGSAWERCSRDELARWNAKLRKRSLTDLLKLGGRDRVPKLLPIKYQRMALSPFVFFRGAAQVMAADLAATKNTGIESQLCGDAHVENLGAYSGEDGRLIFDINDFDETCRGPFEWDLKRMTTSILLAGGDAGIKQGGRVAAADAFLASYCELMTTLSELPILEAARYQVRRLRDIEPVSQILQKAERSTPLTSLKKLTEKTKIGRLFCSDPPLLTRLHAEEARAVLTCLPKYAKSLLPERQRFFHGFRAIDVAFKVVGTGSVGLRDYCIYMEGNGRQDPLFLQVKQEVQSSYAPYLPQHDEKHQGKRVAEGQRAMQLQSDPLLGWTELEGRDYLVRQLNDHKAAVDITQLNGNGLCEYGRVCGEMLARGHARSGDARLIAGYVAKRKRFAGAMLEFANSYAAQTTEDWQAFVKQRPASA